MTAAYLTEPHLWTADDADEAPASPIPPGEQLLDARTVARQTQSQAAAFAGCSLRAWRMYESGSLPMPANDRIVYLLRSGLATWDNATRQLIEPDLSAARHARLARLVRALKAGPIG